MQISDNIRGAALMVGSMTAFTVNDAFMKTLSGEVPVLQAIFLRGIGVTLCLVALCAALGQLRWRLGARNWKLIGLRSIAELGAALLFLTALFNMPIANVSAILQALPLTVSLAGAVFLGEALGWRRLSAITIGFAGVLLIIRPGGADFSIYALAALAAVVLVTFRDLVVRRMSRDIPSVMVALVAAVAVTIGAGVGAAMGDWVPLGGHQWFKLGGAMIAVIGGYVFSVAAMRSGEIGFVAPFRYTSLVVALVLGLVVFGEFPDTLTLIGAAIVVATGLFTLWREARLGQKGPVVAARLR